ncbi:hypothetical protein Ancab_016165 [Ancistrocladus abbreviatus]
MEKTCLSVDGRPLWLSACTDIAEVGAKSLVESTCQMAKAGTVHVSACPLLLEKQDSWQHVTSEAEWRRICRGLLDDFGVKEKAGCHLYAK